MRNRLSRPRVAWDLEASSAFILASALIKSLFFQEMVHLSFSLSAHQGNWFYEVWSFIPQSLRCSHPATTQSHLSNPQCSNLWWSVYSQTLFTSLFLNSLCEKCSVQLSHKIYVLFALKETQTVHLNDPHINQSQSNNAYAHNYTGPYCNSPLSKMSFTTLQHHVPCHVDEDAFLFPCSVWAWETSRWWDHWSPHRLPIDESQSNFTHIFYPWLCTPFPDSWIHSRRWRLRWRIES